MQQKHNKKKQQHKLQPSIMDTYVYSKGCNIYVQPCGGMIINELLQKGVKLLAFHFFISFWNIVHPSVYLLYLICCMQYVVSGSSLATTSSFCLILTLTSTWHVCSLRMRGHFSIRTCLHFIVGFFFVVFSQYLFLFSFVFYCLLFFKESP